MSEEFRLYAMTKSNRFAANRLHRRVVRLLAVLLALASPGLPAALTEPAVYAKKGTWAETVLASRERYAQWWQRQLGEVRLGPWHTTELRVVHSLREPIKLTAPDRHGNRCWHARPELLDGVVHYDLSNHGIHQQRRLPCEEDARATADEATEFDDDSSPAVLLQIRDIESPRPMTLTAWLGAEYGLEVWLNGRRLFSDRRLGNGLLPEPDQAKVELPLAAGTNRLVLRFLDLRRSGFYFSTVDRSRVDSDPIEMLLEQLEHDFPLPTRRLLGDVSRHRAIAWFRDATDVELLIQLTERAVERLGPHNKGLQAELISLHSTRASADARRGLELYAQASRLRKAWSDLESINFAAMRRTIRDLANTFSEQYPRAEEFLRRVAVFEQRLPRIQSGLEQGREFAVREVEGFVALHREALLANPLLDLDRVLLIKRKPLGDPRRAKGPNRGMGEFFGLPQQSAWQLDRIRQPYGWKNEICVLSGLRSDARLETLYRPRPPKLISDLDLHFDGDKLLFSMPGTQHLWQVFEIDVDGRNVRQVSLSEHDDVHNFDACYLPSDKIVFVSTAVKQGVPCSNGIAVAMNYLMDGDGRNVRQLCFDQDHDYCPTVMNDGRVLYLRWDYTDLPHQWPRILFTMNPDGTDQREFYGSNSYWPNAIFYARPIPDHPTIVAGIVTGHHVGRVGELVLFDPARGRHEADGVVQRIPGFGQEVEPIIMDKLTIDSWPKFAHPYPLSGKYFMVACKPGPHDLWGIYLADVFDNLVLLKEVEGCALFEPIPLRARTRPPVIPERIKPGRHDALIFVEDVYRGPGLRGVPRGTIKNLRLFAYNFAYPYKSGGQHRVGTDGPWEPKRVLGTVPVEADGSAVFRVPAQMPISIQALDAQGRAVQLMRSWTTAMPGEIVSCVGCHERQNGAPPSRATIAATRKPSEIKPWHGALRGFSFRREVQPVLDKYCVACHDGTERPDGQVIPDLRGNRDAFVVLKSNDPRPKLIRGVAKEELVTEYSGVFEPAYFELRRFVRVGGLESDLHVLRPCEFNANTTELVHMLEKGHYGVTLDQEAWDRLVTWIDLNAPCHGTWREILGLERTSEDYARRRQLRSLYAEIDDDPEAIPELPSKGIRPVAPQPIAEIVTKPIDCPNWPCDAATAKRRQEAAGANTRRVVDLGGGVNLELVLIPAGEFVMGDDSGVPDERPRTKVRITESFWMGRFEVTNEQYARFDAEHDSRHEHGTASFNSQRAIGPLLNQPKQPVVRISWQEAMAFCDWLSEKAGMNVTLPTEAQWEYACRAGAAEPFYYGDLASDFSRFANMADATINTWATYNEKRRSADQVPRDARFDDHALVTVDVGSYQANSWGLHDMHGNVWEWTRSAYEPYPYRDDDGRNTGNGIGRKTVRGGSWYDRPKRCRSAFRLSYPAWQSVYNVGLRVIGEVSEQRRQVVQSRRQT